ncbi:hypothetical protein V6N13_067673 [Hibiscus sabdariffa]|uniref:Uncharacterized protein n=1 Tax=Hibiscus sabdariffa TaxID=183260 RepID=A0ABR2DU32_9ROSI
MDAYNCKRKGKIPAFGNWNCANELPITQCFDCAGSVGVGKPKPYSLGDLNTVDLKAKHCRNRVPVRKVSRVREKRGGGPLVKEEETAAGVCDVTEPPRKHHVHVSNNIKDKQLGNHVVLHKSLPLTTPKLVDEDLYQIPPEILHSSNRVSSLYSLLSNIYNILLLKSFFLHMNDKL